MNSASAVSGEATRRLTTSLKESLEARLSSLSQVSTRAARRAVCSTGRNQGAYLAAGTDRRYLGVWGRGEEWGVEGWSKRLGRLALSVL